MNKIIKISPFGIKKGAKDVEVEIEGLTEVNYNRIVSNLKIEIAKQDSISEAVAKSYAYALKLVPGVNPSDLWQHVIYRSLLVIGYSDPQWKRISGYALERVLVMMYSNRLAKIGLTIRCLSKPEAKGLIAKLGLAGKVKDAKVDCVIENSEGVVAGVHVKASLAERIQDDVPASLAFINHGLLSIVVTLDSKSFPPPMGNGVNYGELGGRTNCSDHSDKIKRQYVEVDGQFSALFSYNLRTPPTKGKSPSGCNIFTQTFESGPNDHLTNYLKDHVKEVKKAVPAV